MISKVYYKILVLFGLVQNLEIWDLAMAKVKKKSIWQLPGNTKGGSITGSSDEWKYPCCLMMSNLRLKRIDGSLARPACLVLVELPASTELWCHNQCKSSIILCTVYYTTSS
jgi:hypothetical protein